MAITSEMVDYYCPPSFGQRLVEWWAPQLKIGRRIRARRRAYADIMAQRQRRIENEASWGTLEETTDAQRETTEFVRRQRMGWAPVGPARPFMRPSSSSSSSSTSRPFMGTPNPPPFAPYTHYPGPETVNSGTKKNHICPECGHVSHNRNCCKG